MIKVEESMRGDYIGNTKLQCPVIAGPVRLRFCLGYCDKSTTGKCKVYILKRGLAASEFDEMIVQSTAAV